MAIMTKQEKRLRRHRETSRIWRAKNLERAKANWKRWYRANKEALRARDRGKYWANPEKYREEARRWWREHPEKAKERDKQWREAHADWVRERLRLWHKKHPGKSKEYNQKRVSTVEGRLKRVLRRRIMAAGIASSRALPLLGCSIDFLRKHLQSQFKAGMSWDNYGRKTGRNGWVVDHIRPCAAFDLTDPKQWAKCFHWSNLQPLWDHENAKKHAKSAHE